MSTDRGNREIKDEKQMEQDQLGMNIAHLGHAGKAGHWFGINWTEEGRMEPALSAQDNGAQKRIDGRTMVRAHGWLRRGGQQRPGEKRTGFCCGAK